MTEVQQPRRVRDGLGPDVPQLVIETQFTLRFSQHIDMVGYYAGLSERGQEYYASFVENEQNGYEPYETVVNFLFPKEDDGADVDGAPSYKEGVVDHHWVDDDGEYEAWVRYREGAPGRNYGRAETTFTAEDFAYLRSHAPWLDEFWTRREQSAIAQIVGTPPSFD